MAVITGNTYPIREKLKALGGVWKPALKGWIIPDSKADEARALVSGTADKTTKSGGVRRGPRVCATCGCRINYGVYCGKCEYR